MRKNFLTQLMLPLGLSIISSACTIWLFFRALIFPLKYANFIFLTSMLILVVEFCSIFCNVIIIQIKNTYKEKLPQNQKIIGLVKLFLIFLIIVAIVILLGFFGAKNYYIPIIFALSVINKLSNHLTGRQVMIKKEIATPALTLLFTIVFAAATSTFWVKLFPFSEEVLKMKPENLVITGALQDLLVWGVLYYLMLEIINILSFRKQINS